MLVLEHLVQFVMFSESAPSLSHAFSFSKKEQVAKHMYSLLMLGWLTMSHNLKNLLKCIMGFLWEAPLNMLLSIFWETHAWIQK